MLTDRLPRVRLGYLPTPLEEMPRLTKSLNGPRLLIKRDDQTGLATGGNKTRKLEFIIGQALQDGIDTLITSGAVQSNHCRQTAAAAARFGLRCITVLEGHPPELWTGNLLRDKLLGAEIVFSGDLPCETKAGEVYSREINNGKKALLIPVGGSNATGAAGFAAAMEEFLNQIHELNIQVDRIVFAGSSCGTHAGLLTGAAALNYAGKLEAISVSRTKSEIKEKTLAIAETTLKLLQLDISPDREMITAHDDYLGGGYAIMGEPEKEAILMTARNEGILLDPVYTGKAMAGLIDLVRRGFYGKNETVVFWHTGGSAALDAYSEGLCE